MLSPIDTLYWAAKVLFVVALILLARVATWLLNLLLIAPTFDPLRQLPGPDTKFFHSHLSLVNDPSYSADTHREWTRTYGNIVRFHGLGKYDYRLMALDFRAVTHVLSSPAYEKPPATRYLLGSFLGRGVFATEGQEHKLQRKIIAPAFATQAVNNVTPLFYEKAAELREIWANTIAISSSQGEENIEVSHWLSRATFDAFGLAGFGYHFNALQGEANELYNAFRQLFTIAFEKSLLSLKYPIVDKLFPSEQVKQTKKCLAVVHETRSKLFMERKAMILTENQGAQKIEDKDLLSLLMKSNLSNDPSKRLSDSDLLDQLSAFLFAGSDSTSVAITWCLHLLATNPDIQSRLRTELLSVSSTDTFDAYDRLPLLDAVIRETLRLCPPIHGTLREAMQDDFIPVSSAVPLRDGSIVPAGGSIRIRKGTYVHIPIEGLNMHEDIWGPDATQFNPDRWLHPLPPHARAPTFPGVANIMSFGLGPHSCPGWKFAVVEMRAFIATLLPEFVFGHTEEQNIGKFNGILMRPFDRAEWRAGKGLKLSMLVSRYEG